MKNSIQVVVSGFMALALCSCQSLPYQPYARDVKRKPKANGIIALKLEHRTEDRQKAEQMMASNCSSLPVKVVEEGEVVVGQETTAKANKSKEAGQQGAVVGSLFGLPVTSGGRDPSEKTESSSVTTSVKEWQISYECDSSMENQKRAKR